MRNLFTPKQVAHAIQVSESSVKRWCDKGVIRTEYTAGGHRRIPLDGLLDFLRSSRRELVNPQHVGLPVLGDTVRASLGESASHLMASLLKGDEPAARQTVINLYLAEHSISAIFDQVIAVAFDLIGSQWECGDADVYQERRSCEIMMRLIHELRTLVPSPELGAPTALGGTIAGDYYTLPTMMVELVLRDQSWNAISLGTNLPFSSFANAIIRHRPKIFWISCSHLPHEGEFIQGFNELFDSFGRQIAFVVGGRALTEEIRSQLHYTSYCESLVRLEDFAQSILPHARPPDG